MASGKKVSAAQRTAFGKFIETQGSTRFRRQDLAKDLFRVTNPRSMEAANKLADLFLGNLKSMNKLVKDGHVHWRIVVAEERTLKSGRTVPELPEVMELGLDTRCPQKWAAVDLETGELWVGAAGGWQRADSTVRAEVSAIIEGAAGK